jgi:hypothetical protein
VNDVSDDPYRSIAPKVYRGSTVCFVVTDISAVTIDPAISKVTVFLRSGLKVERDFTGKDALELASRRFSELADAVVGSNQ